MAQMFTLVSLITIIASEALAPCGTVAPAAPAAPVGYTTTPAGVTCDTPLCQGLVGAGVGVAGLAAIGGIAGALAQKKHAPPAASATAAPIVEPIVTTASPVIFNREADTTTAAPGSSDGWLLPLLLGLLTLCCILGLIGYFCMKPKDKRATKVKKTKKAAPAPDNKDTAVAPLEAAPLLATGHWEQPRQMVPVTTAQTSMVPQVTTAQYAMAAPTYTETVVPSYAMMPTPTYTETVAPTAAYAIAPAFGTGGLVGTTGYPVTGGYAAGVVPGSVF
mmetsp:Transcript_106644/g.168498  ORF Transcript_106644/g.168498 Transcript_106644/m.168498 type:complete len:276 (+) Transcript_106644:71-898(+)